MILSLALALLQTTGTWSAQWDANSNQQRILRVIRNGRSHTIEQFPLGGIGPPERALSTSSNGVVIQGHRLKAVGTSLIDVATGQRVDIVRPKESRPDEPSLRSKGAIAMVDRVLWIFASDLVEVSLEPSIRVFAFEVADRNGRPSILRTAELPGLLGYDSGIYAIRHGNDVLLANMGGKCIDFNLKQWSQVSSAQPSVVFSSAGHAYRADLGKLSEWSFSRRAWEYIRNVDLGGLFGVTKLGQDELLTFNHGLMLAKSGQSYPYPPNYRGDPIQVDLYIDPKLGVGFASLNPMKEGEQEVFLGTDLKPRCTIAPRVFK